MIIYLVIRETTWRIPPSYGDYGDYYETETVVFSAHRTAEDAEKMIETATALDTNKDVRYYCESVELE